jgi:hypothetical protein
MSKYTESRSNKIIVTPTSNGRYDERLKSAQDLLPGSHVAPSATKDTIDYASAATGIGFVGIITEDIWQGRTKDQKTKAGEVTAFFIPGRGTIAQVRVAADTYSLSDTIVASNDGTGYFKKGATVGSVVGRVYEAPVDDDDNPVASAAGDLVLVEFN